MTAAIAGTGDKYGVDHTCPHGNPPGSDCCAPVHVGGRELDAFLGEAPSPYDWLVPGLIERQDRLILTGTEGVGKSTLLRQAGVQFASGIHPFGGEEFEPLRVLNLDLENTQRYVHRSLHPMRAAAGRRYAGTMIVEVRTEGLDLLNPEDRDWFLALAAEHRPDVLITGPAYKMAAGDPTEEMAARVVAGCLDRIRRDHHCAVLLEAHSPHATEGKKRPIRPYGASLWMRWPEFGLHLSDAGHLLHWRGARDERDWPAALQRGGAWPWTPRGSGDIAGQVLAILADKPWQLTREQLIGELGGSHTLARSVIAGLEAKGTIQHEPVQRREGNRLIRRPLYAMAGEPHPDGQAELSGVGRGWVP